MRVLNGSEIVIECLKEQGVDTVFGYPGGTILNIYDALYQHQDEITHILTCLLYTSSSIREFALPLMVGIVCGTYSSVCLTGAMWYVMRKKKEA